MNKFRILFYDMDLPYLLSDGDVPFGGSSVRINAFCRGLSNLEQDVGVLTFKGAKEIITTPSNYNIIESFDKAKGIKYLRWAFYRIPVLFLSIQKYKPDVLFQKSFGWITLVLLIISRLLKIKFVYLVSSDIETISIVKKDKNFVALLFSVFCLNHSDIIICQNKLQKYNLVKVLSNDKIFIVKNPFYINDNPTFSERIIIKKKDYVAWVGNFRRIKGLDLLFEYARKNSGINFRIAGILLKAYDTELDLTIQSLMLLPNVEFVGNVKRKDMSDFIGSANILLNTSEFEGFSNTFLEAFYVGTPIVSAYVNPDGIFNNRLLGVVSNGNLKFPFKGFIESIDYEEYYRLSGEYLRSNHNYLEKARELLNIIRAL